MSHRNHGNHRNFLSTEHTEKAEITGKRCWLKIIFKILVKISSISDAIPIKILPKSEVFERILVKDFGQRFFWVAYGKMFCRDSA